MQQFLAVKNYEKFQHYKDRSPPWIKLYKSLLEDLAFLALPEAAQAQLIKLWIVASTCYNRIPYDPRLIGQLVHARGKLYLTELMSAGFLHIASAPDSNGASNHDSNASAAPRAFAREGEGELEKETENKTSSARARAGRDLLLDQLAPSQREAMRGTLAMFAEGHDLGAGYGVPTAVQFDKACREVVASVPASQITARLVRGFLKSAMRPNTAVPPATRNKDEGFADAL